MTKTYFGIPLNCANEHNAVNLAARLFLCPQISAEHAAMYLNMLSNESITIDKMLEKTDYVIPKFKESLENGEDLSAIMYNKLNEWNNIFTAPSKEDFDYIDKYTESLGIRSCQYKKINIDQSLIV